MTHAPTLVERFFPRTPNLSPHKLAFSLVLASCLRSRIMSAHHTPELARALRRFADSEASQVLTHARFDWPAGPYLEFSGEVPDCCKWRVILLLPG